MPNIVFTKINYVQKSTLRTVNRHSLLLWQLNFKSNFSVGICKPNTGKVLGSSILQSSFLKNASQERTLFHLKCRSAVLQTSFVLQKRNFSFKESFEYAVNTHYTIFKSISESAVVEYAQNFTVQLHDVSGLPWWLSIILTSCIIRSVFTFPVAIYQNYVLAKLENLKPEMDEIVNNIQYATNREARRNKWPAEKARRHFKISVRKEWTRLIERDNCHPVKTAILAIIQIPLWVIFSTALRNLVYKLPENNTYAQLKYLELSVGGVAWFPDLTVPDSFIIPIAFGVTNLTIVQIQAMMHKGQRSRLHRTLTMFFQCFSVFMIPVAATVPCCLTLYWTTSSFFGLCQNLTLLSPRFRRLVGIPTTPSTNLHPYAHLVEQIKNKFSNL